MGGTVPAWQVLLGAMVTIAGSWLVYKGARFTSTRAKEGVEVNAEVAAQESALKAWQGLLQPHIDEVARLRTEQTAEREKHEAAQRRTDGEMDHMRERIQKLSLELGEWKRVARAIAKWAIQQRDEVIRLGGTAPATPEELLTLQAIDESKNSR